MGSNTKAISNFQELVSNGKVTDLNSWEVKNKSVRLEFASLKKITVVFLILSHPAAESLKLMVLNKRYQNKSLVL